MGREFQRNAFDFFPTHFLNMVQLLHAMPGIMRVIAKMGDGKKRDALRCTCFEILVMRTSRLHVFEI